MAYQEYLLTQAELKISARRLHSRIKNLEEVYKQCDLNIPYQKREYYVETRHE